MLICFIIYFIFFNHDFRLFFLNLHNKSIGRFFYFYLIVYLNIDAILDIMYINLICYLYNLFFIILFNIGKLNKYRNDLNPVINIIYFARMVFILITIIIIMVVWEFGECFQILILVIYIIIHMIILYVISVII